MASAVFSPPVPWRQPGGAPRDPASPAAGRAKSRGFQALIVLSAIMFLSPQSYLPVLAPLRIALVAAVASLALLVVETWRRSDSWIRETPQAFWALCLVAWSIATVPLSLWPAGSLDYISGLYVKNVIVFLLIAGCVRTFSELRTYAWALSLLVLPTALKLTRDFVAGNFATTAGVTRVGGDGGLTGNPNDIALLLNIVLPLTIALLLSERSVRTRLVLSGMIGASVLAIVLSYSRGGFITLAVSVALHLWRVGRTQRHRWIWIAVPLALAATPLLPATYFDRLSTIVDSGSDDTGSSQERQRDLAAALSFVAANPVFGSGIGMNTLALNDVRGTEWTAVHNVYLQHAVELGLPGVLLFLLLFRSSLMGAAAAARKTHGDEVDDPLALLAQGVWISLTAFAVAAMFHPVAFHAFFYFLAGLSAAAASAHRERLRQGSGMAAASRTDRHPPMDWRQPVWPRPSSASRA